MKRLTTTKEFAALPVGTKVAARGKKLTFTFTKEAEGFWVDQRGITYTNTDLADAVDNLTLSHRKGAEVREGLV